MNILKRELRTGRKAFIFWTIGLFLIVFAGMTKYTGFSGETGALEIFNTFPKIVLSVFGIVGVDISTLGGFYAIVVYYSIICAAIYGISLGCSAVNREEIDKTYEFIFTKPRSRSFVLTMKLLAGFIYMTLYSILSYIFSLVSIATLKIENTIKTPIVLLTVSMWFISILFFTLAAFIATIIKNPEKGSLYSNLAFILTFCLGIAYDMVENNSIIKIFSPLKYFLPNDVLAGKLDVLYIAICIVLSIVFYIFTMYFFEKKDL